MLRIKKIQSGFMKDVHIGRYVKFIELDENGYDTTIEDVVNIAILNSTVVIKHKDVFKFKEISQVCKHINKLNPNTKMVIYTNGMTKPIGMNQIRDIEYVVFVNLKNSGLSYNNRINETSLGWFAKTNTRFVFDVYNKDDMNEISDLMILTSINKNQIYINIKSDNFSEYVTQCEALGYNIYVKFVGEWTEDEKCINE
jgi:hypothetical protein